VGLVSPLYFLKVLTNKSLNKIIKRYEVKKYHSFYVKKTAPVRVSTVDVTDILEVLGQNNFSNRKQIELLQVLNFALYQKHYPLDTCGIVEKKIKLLEMADEKFTQSASEVHLSTKKGFKVNFIRVINCLCELSFFTDKRGNDITKKEVFNAFGKAINHDLTAFQNDLSTTKAAATSDMKNTLLIFEKLYAKQQEINEK